MAARFRMSTALVLGLAAIASSGDSRATHVVRPPWDRVDPALTLIGANIAGRVLDASTGQPLPGSVVHVRKRHREVVVDSTGAFVVEDVPEGQYTLWVSRPTHAWKTFEATFRRDAPETVTVRLDSLRTFKGYSGKPQYRK